MIDNMYNEQDEISKIKQELKELRETVKLLSKEIDNFKRIPNKRHY